MKDIFYQNKYNLTLSILLFVTAFSLPFSSAFNSISFTVLFIYSFVFFKSDLFLNNLTYKKVYVFYILFFLFQVISVYYSSDKTLAFDKITKNVIFFIAPITFINLRNNIDKDKLTFVFFGLLTAVLATLIVAYYYLFKQVFFEDVPYKYFVREKFIENGIYEIHVPYLAMLIVFLIVCSYKISFHSKVGVNRILKFASMSFLSLSLFQLAGMMSIFIFCIFIGTVIFSAKLSKLRKITIILLISSLSIFFLQTLKNSNKVVRDKGSESIVYRIQNIIEVSDPVRKENWRSVVKVISSNLLLGVGVDGGLELLQKERNINSEAYINKHNAHNEILEILLRFGFVGLIIYILILVKLIKKAFLTNNYYFKWALAIFIISGLTESYLQRQIGLMFFVFFSLFFYTFKAGSKQKLNQLKS
tara:strand:+ start:348334 stop:349584 length:1251 start_codon:yes stop_codon:yes gene_type:complete